MSRMSGILILRYIQLKCQIPFVSYCFQLHKIVYIFGTVSPILMRFLAKQSSLNSFTSKLQNQNLIVPEMRLIRLMHHKYRKNTNRLLNSNLFY